MSSFEWPFAPLGQAGQHSKKRRLGGIVFDVDGTLCEPQNYMFQEMREALGIQKPTDILDHIHSLPEADQREAHAKIQAIERRAMAVQKPQPGLLKLMQYLEEREMRKAICTRNFDEPVDHLLRNFLPQQHFSPVITRAFTPPKPSPAGILHIASQWGIPAESRACDLIMVGDSIDDMVAGSKAGSTTVLLKSEANLHLIGDECTHVAIDRLDELVSILEEGVTVAENRTI